MKKYIKKKIVIEAEQWFPEKDILTNIVKPYHKKDGICGYCNRLFEKHGEIDTLEGTHIVCPEDFIIKGIKGEYYPCKPDIFFQTYEPYVENTEKDFCCSNDEDHLLTQEENFIAVNMNEEKVILKSKCKLNKVIHAARICYDSINLSDSDKEHLGEKDKKLIKNLIRKGHHSVFEHLTYNFHIKNVSRGLLQQLVRHRVSSISVQSTRYTLTKRLKNEDKFDWLEDYYESDNLNRIKKYLVLTGNLFIDNNNITTLNTIIDCVNQKDKYCLTNDIIKYMLPEAFKTEFYWSINIRSLRNFLNLRYDKHAHIEIRYLASEIIDVIPEEHKQLLFFDILKDKGEVF